ncbi:DUF2809 domain-containing protein [Vibrio intestinalis]|uniref:ribosomal maturation YjgA family protein n=1 Tax=Vibrio intestinalis TaxID=2933291 RepID=UPI0021A7AFD7|nr:DUF2809 domain-containing protein [Vibrio intestinalis]
MQLKLHSNRQMFDELVDVVKHPIKHIRFSMLHAVLSIALFAVLVFVAVWVEDSFIRPTLGDVLVVIWLYHVFATLLNVPARLLATVVVVIAYLVELAQLFNVVDLLGIPVSSPLRIIFGATFDWLDLVAYTVGGLLCVLLSMLSASTREE